MAVVGTWFGRQWGLGRASPNALPLCTPVPPGSKGKTFLCIKLRGQGSWASTLRWDTLGLSWKWVFSAGAVLPLARTRWCLLHHRGWQHGPCKLKAGHLVPFVQFSRKIKSNPWSTVKRSTERLTRITPALDPFQAIYKHWLTNPPCVAGGRSRDFFTSLPLCFLCASRHSFNLQTRCDHMTIVAVMTALLDWEWGITRSFWRGTGGKKSHHPKQRVRPRGLNRSTATGAGCELLQQTHSKSVLSSRPPIWSWLLKSRGIPAMTSVQTRHRKPNCKDISNQDQTLGLFVQISTSTKDSPDHGCNWHSSEGSQDSGEGE